MKRFLPLVILAGCSMSPTERAWQALHIIDVAQTLNGPATDPCYREEAWDTHALIGAHPDRDAVIAWGVGMAVLHYAADRWLEQSELPGGWKLVLRSVSLGYKGATVGANHTAGIRPFGDNVSCQPPPYDIPERPGPLI